MENKQFDDSALFYGTVPVFFKQIDGKVYKYDSKEFHESDAEDLVINARIRQHPRDDLGPEYSKLIVPAIPATDIQVENMSLLSDVSLWPKELQRPLIKAPSGPIRGVASGIRSALIQIADKWYRLKGCGNNDEGFIIENINKNGDLINIRGCCFEWTTHRELYITQLISTLLHKEGLLCGNESYGWYEYNTSGYSLPLVKRTCVLFECIGERRLNDHLLSGLEELLPYFFNDSIDITKIINKFDDNRKVDDTIMETWLAITMGISPPYVDLSDIQLSNINITHDSTRIPQLNEQFAQLWKDNAISLKNVHIMKVYSKLYWTLGREVGQIMRILHHNNISWGTYKDKLGMHCNAHTNNLVIREENSDKKGPFLAMLDLDMAFTKTSHLFVTDDRKKDDNAFDEWINLEKIMMKMALSGDPECSTGIGIDNKLNDKCNIIRIGLRDTMMNGYLSGLKDNDSNKQQYIMDDDMYRNSYNLIRLALMMTVSKIA